MSWSSPSFLAGPASRANGRRSRPGETDRMRCSHGNLDAVAASGTPNPKKEATPDTPAICAVNEPADKWRQSAWPGIRWTGFPKAKPAAAAGIQVRLSSAAHHGGNASRWGRNRSATAAQVLQDGTARSHQKEPANVVSTRAGRTASSDAVPSGIRRLISRGFLALPGICKRGYRLIVIAAPLPAWTARFAWTRRQG